VLHVTASRLGSRIVGVVRRALQALAWLVVAILIAAGAGGAVQGAEHPPTDAARPELTYRADARLAPRIAALRAGIVALQQQASQLGDLGRDALVNMAARDRDRLTADLDAGDQVVLGIESYADQLGTALRAIEAGPDAAAAGPASRASLGAVDVALHAVVPVAQDWAQVSAGAVPAISLTGLLTTHDQQAFDAIRQGGGAHYSTALDGLAKAIATLDTATKVRDQLAASGTDTATIDGWIAANRAYDVALQKLYGLLRKSPNRVTSAIRSAYAAVQVAQKALPASTQGLVVIVDDVAQGGLNQALVDIDACRGSLALAAAAID
jgi:hypothetical protein